MIGRQFLMESRMLLPSWQIRPSFDGSVGVSTKDGNVNQLGLDSRITSRPRCAGIFQIGDNLLIALARFFELSAEPVPPLRRREAVALSALLHGAEFGFFLVFNSVRFHRFKRFESTRAVCSSSIGVFPFNR